MEEIKKYSCGFILMYKNEEAPLFLVCKSTLLHHWGFPKGGKEEGETDLETAYRETKEEVGISEIDHQDHIESEVFSYVMEAGPNIGKLKQVTLFTGLVSEKFDPNCQDDVCEAEWLTEAEAIERITHKPTKEALGSVARQL